ncbi:lipoprotein insertase outer membrane protein LolB [Marinospirillum insulare]|uniref:Outer-membrane lipoprotein LolB n=1 Tax=Marinospirillum insulare TaxID=217169 RepID=A0ABQ5ZX43_9GAMM|nr:lipoprotein insertase outer membrane protein LolB [Marinospirillum insulare]GLR64750.1 outer-membrane lipoprotein LolB [Marinospirillum insulare]
MQPYLKPLVIGALLLVISACTSQPSLPTATDDLTPNAQLWHWQAQGRIAFANNKNNHSANLDWQQNGYNYQLQLFGPLGQGSARLEGAPFKVILTTSDGKQVEASSPEQLLADNSDWELPLSNMLYWIRGIKAPGKHKEINENSFLQHGWQVEWRRFSQVGEHQLPSLLIAEKGPLSFRLAINKWQIFSTPSKEL